MSPETRVTFEKRKRALFEAVLNLPESERAAFLSKATRDDPSVADAVCHLLSASRDTSHGVLNLPICDRAQQPPLRSPISIGPYVVLRRLGTGGMGSVYLCSQPHSEVNVAVKVVRSDLQSSYARSHFERERDILKRLHHPNVCRLLDAGVAEGGTPFIAMEFINGEHLDSYCLRTACSVGQRLLLFSQILAGVQYFHASNVVHRDLKPSNLLVTPSGSIRILDFGLAKMIDHRKGRTGHGPTATAFPFMTVRYASPEQLSGRLSGRGSDIYSLGLLCYELLTGRHPFAQDLNKTPQMLLRAILKRVPTPPSQCVKGLSPSLDNLVMNALQPNPGNRYLSVAAFSQDLRAFMEGLTVPQRFPASQSKKAAAP